MAASSGFDSVVKALVAGGARLTSNRLVLLYYVCTVISPIALRVLRAGKTPMDVATTAAVKSELEKAT